ncbi:MAG: hypothetical protein ACRDPH_10820 [Marmoricola sp.]
MATSGLLAPPWRSRHVLRAVLAVLVVLAVASCTRTQELHVRLHVRRDTTCPATTLSRSGPQTTGIFRPNTDGTWHLGDATWSREAPVPMLYPIRSEHWTRGCIIGGVVHGDVPRHWTRDRWYNAEAGRMSGEAFRQTLTDVPGNYLYIRDAFVSDYEDAYDPNGVRADSVMHLDHVRAEYIRDDCVEDEGDGPPQVPISVIITNTLFDGCFSGLAERPPGSTTATNGDGPQSLDVENSLIHIRPEPLGPLYCSDEQVPRGRCLKTGRPDVWLGAYGIWKWSNMAASHVTVRNTIFRLDIASYSSCQSQEWPAGTYRHVTLVWTGKGPYATAGGCHNVLPRGVHLTTDVSVWKRARAAWLAETPAPTRP